MSRVVYKIQRRTHRICVGIQCPELICPTCTTQRVVLHFYPFFSHIVMSTTIIVALTPTSLDPRVWAGEVHVSVSPRVAPIRGATMLVLTLRMVHLRPTHGWTQNPQRVARGGVGWGGGWMVRSAVLVSLEPYIGPLALCTRYHTATYCTTV